MSTHLPHLVAFGNFQLDTHAGELWAGNQKVRLQEQPLQILMMLLERAGAVVTRQEITRKLWPQQSVNDLEDSLNHAIYRLREALGDPMEHPRFIETLPRRGFRFVARVEALSPGRSSLGRRWSTAPVPRIESLAVLPLLNLSRDPEQEYFADGITDALITYLSKISTLRLISRTSVMRYKRTKKPLPQIAKELNVDAVVEGTVLRSGSQVRISAQLIQVNPERHLWVESYERDLRDILSVQAEITQAIARQIRGTLTVTERARVGKTRPVDPEAYQLYLQGNFQNLRQSESAYQRAIEYFEQAVKRDPCYAAAYAGLSMAYQGAGGLHSSLPFSAFHTQAKEAARKALELDHSLAEAHIALGRIEFYEWNWAAADRELRRGRELNPTSTPARILHANCLTALGRFEESVAVGKQTIELDPLCPDAYNQLGWALMYGGRDADALAQFEKGLELDPRFAQTHRLLAGFYVRKGMTAEALRHMRKMESFMDETRPPAWLGSLALYYARLGRREAALKILSELESRAKTGYVPPTALARAHLGLGDKEKALSFLEEAYEDRHISLVWLKVDWGYDPLRSDPRFQDLLRCMNFPP